MGGNAHMIVVQIPVAIKQKHIRLRLQLFGRFNDQRRLAKRKKTGNIRHADFPHAVHFFNHFFVSASITMILHTPYGSPSCSQ